MRSCCRNSGIIALLALLFGLLPPERARASEKLYYAVEMRGDLVGFMEAEILPRAPEANGLTLIRSHLLAKLSLMEKGMDLEVREECRLDPDSGQVVRYEMQNLFGESKSGVVVEVEGGKARHTTQPGGMVKEIPLGAGVIVDDPLRFPYLIRDAEWAAGGKPRDFQILDYASGDVHRVTYTPSGRETLDLWQKTYPTLSFDWVDEETGLRGKFWIDPDSGLLVKAIQPNGITVYRAGPEVAAQIKRADLDSAVFARVAMPSVDFRRLTSMKVKACINSAGERLSPESLNVPGQRFEGEVQDNRIDGVFETAPQRYLGNGAPAFPVPADLPGMPSVRKYLEPEAMVESNDPVLAEKAATETAGARDAWDAVTRLSAWVACAITYEIPGGSARQTYDSRKGDCGGQSRLLCALCRAAGVPARMVSGCMFTPYFGGSFGLHTWVEVYLGEAGWIPVDATAGETDYIDAGHIRLGERASFLPESMEVLDYSTESGQRIEPEETGLFGAVGWEKGESAVFRYAFDGREVGKDRFEIESRETGPEGTVLVAKTQLDLQGRNLHGAWSLRPDGTPLHYLQEGKAGTVDYGIECDFKPKEVTEKIRQSEMHFERTIPLEGRVFLVDNNNFSLFCFLVAGLSPAPGKAWFFKVFHPTSMEVLPLHIQTARQENLLWKGEEHACWVLDLNLDGTPIKLWVDGDRRILRETEQNGRLVLERE